LPYEQLVEHEAYCGNRTDNCEICNAIFTFKDMPQHLSECLESITDKPLKRKAPDSKAKKRLKKAT